jgi:hypothetical protein
MMNLSPPTHDWHTLCVTHHEARLTQPRRDNDAYVHREQCCRTGCEFYVAQKLLTWAKVEGHSCIRERCGQKNAWYSVVECEAGMRVFAAFFDPCAPWALTSPGSVFSHDFNRLDRFAKLATSSLFIPPVVRGVCDPPSARTSAVIRPAMARCTSCEPAGVDCEPRINHVGLGADNVGREHPTESIIVGLEGAIIASRAFNECELLQLGITAASLP